MGRLLDGPTPCSSTIRVILGSPDPGGAMVRCGLTSGHEGDHEHSVRWSDIALETEQTIRDHIARYLASRRDDPDFMRRLRERIEQDRHILDRLAEDDASETRGGA